MEVGGGGGGGGGRDIHGVWRCSMGEMATS